MAVGMVSLLLTLMPKGGHKAAGSLAQLDMCHECNLIVRHPGLSGCQEHCLAWIQAASRVVTILRHEGLGKKDTSSLQLQPGLGPGIGGSELVALLQTLMPPDSHKAAGRLTQGPSGSLSTCPCAAAVSLRANPASKCVHLTGT